MTWSLIFSFSVFNFSLTQCCASNVLEMTGAGHGLSLNVLYCYSGQCIIGRRQLGRRIWRHCWDWQHWYWSVGSTSSQRTHWWQWYWPGWWYSARSSTSSCTLWPLIKLRPKKENSLQDTIIRSQKKLVVFRNSEMSSRWLKLEIRLLTFFLFQ